MINIKEELLLLKENNYKEFTSKITPSKYEFLGVRIPDLRKLSKKIDITYLEENHSYFEEIMLEGMVIGNIKDINQTIFYTERFISKIDNWSICDSFCCGLKITKKHKKQMFEFIKKYKKSKKEFEKRFLIVMLLDFYICDEYINEIFKIIETIKKHEYYVQMAVAWLLSVCYIKYEEKTYNYLLNNNLDDFTFNKTISKICDSYRVSKEKKELLKKLRK